MGIEVLSQRAREAGSFVFQIDFTDEVGTATVPVSATWSLVDSLDAVVNSRDKVPITSLAATVYVAVHGDDLLATGDSETDIRFFVVESTYLSALTGSILPANRAARFRITDLPGI